MLFEHILYIRTHRCSVLGLLVPVLILRCSDSCSLGLRLIHVAYVLHEFGLLIRVVPRDVVLLVAWLHRGR